MEHYSQEQQWKTDHFLVSFRPGALFSAAPNPRPLSARNPRSGRQPRTPGEMPT